MPKTNLRLRTDYTFDDSTMMLFNIPKIELIEDRKEIWRFCIFDRHSKESMKKRYMVSNYGRVYDFKESKMLEIKDSTLFKSKVCPYKFVSIKIKNEDGKKTTAAYLMHRLVMLAFTDSLDEISDIVNHKDGDPSHNYLWNLEWASFSENYIHALKTGLKLEKHGEDRSNALWSNDEIRVICQMIEDGHKATFIYNALLEILDHDPKVQYERVRTLYKHIKHKTHWTEISKDFDIDYTPFNYSKEQSSVKKKEENPKLK